MNQNNEPSRAEPGTSGLANARTRTRSETIAARGRTRNRRQPGQWAKYSTGQWQHAASSKDLVGRSDLVDKNKKCRRGGCMQHLVFSRDSKDKQRTQDEPVQFGKNTARCNVWARAACGPGE